MAVSHHFMFRSPGVPLRFVLSQQTKFYLGQFIVGDTVVCEAIALRQFTGCHLDQIFVEPSWRRRHIGFISLSNLIFGLHCSGEIITGNDSRVLAPLIVPRVMADHAPEFFDYVETELNRKLPVAMIPDVMRIK